MILGGEDWVVKRVILVEWSIGHGCAISFMSMMDGKA